MQERRLVLASSSPRRREILDRDGYRFATDPADIDEEVAAGEDPLVATCRLATEKAVTVARRRGDEELVLAADTSVICGGRMYGKPQSNQDACTQLHALAGRNHDVVTAWTLMIAGRDPATARSGWTRSLVRMRELHTPEIRAYVARGESSDKAGGYAAQGLGAGLIGAVVGSLDNVVGLPIGQIAPWLDRFGVRPGRGGAG